MRIEALNYALRDIPEEKIRPHSSVNMGPRIHPLADDRAHVEDQGAGHSFEAANPPMHEYHIFEDLKLPTAS